VAKKEFLAIVYSINKFQHYITGYPTFVHTDYSTIQYLMNKAIINGRVTGWLLLLQEFDIAIVDKPKKDNVFAYFLSRITNKGESIVYFNLVQLITGNRFLIKIENI